MLVIERKQGETVFVGNAEIKVLSIRGNRIRLGFDAPPEVRILRAELMDNAPSDSFPVFPGGWQDGGKKAA